MPSIYPPEHTFLSVLRLLFILIGFGLSGISLKRNITCLSEFYKKKPQFYWIVSFLKQALYDSWMSF